MVRILVNTDKSMRSFVYDSTLIITFSEQSPIVDIFYFPLFRPTPPNLSKTWYDVWTIIEPLGVFRDLVSNGWSPQG